MATTSVKVDSSILNKRLKKLAKNTTDGRTFWPVLEALFDQFTGVTFKNRGARAGKPKWKRLSLLTIHPSWRAKNSEFPLHRGRRYNPNKFNRRLGTDNSRSRRYGTDDTPLRASGGFQKSFRRQKSSRNKFAYGTKFKGTKGVTAKNIMSNPRREVLFLTNSDYTLIKKKYLLWLTSLARRA